MVVHVVEDLRGKGVSDGGPHVIEHDDHLRVQGKATPGRNNTMGNVSTKSDCVLVSLPVTLRLRHGP